MTSYDEWYNRWSADTTSNACILRVTNRCDQECLHCCFRSGPKCVGQMSVRMCEKINAWVPKEIVLNIMGGEFTILDNYPQIIKLLSVDRSYVHLVTNGFWSRNRRSAQKFLDTIRQIKSTSTKIDVAVSTDSWHTQSQLGNHALKLLKNSDLEIDLINTDDLVIGSITPIGRAWDNNLVPFTYIHRSCEAMCNMTITEDGMISRCPYGYLPWKHFSETTWADAQEYIWGWRSEKLSEGMNCHLCMETVKASQCERA